MPKMIKDDECPEGLPGWLATFGDLMSLLLPFFVLLLSFSSTEDTTSSPILTMWNPFPNVSHRAHG